VWEGWQLQYRRELAFGQSGQQDGLATGKLKHVMMYVLAFLIGLSEPRYLPECLLGRPPTSEKVEKVLISYLLVECNLGTRKTAHGDARFADGRKPARWGIGESGRH
jgi:hypothetical protein